MNYSDVTPPHLKVVWYSIKVQEIQVSTLVKYRGFCQVDSPPWWCELGRWLLGWACAMDEGKLGQFALVRKVAMKKERQSFGLNWRILTWPSNVIRYTNTYTCVQVIWHMSYFFWSSGNFGRVAVKGIRGIHQTLESIFNDYVCV